MPRRFRRSRRPARRIRRRPVRRIRRRTNPNLHYFKRVASLGTVGTNASGYMSYATSFNLAQLPNSTDFTTLFDQYSIRKVVVKMYPYFTDNNTSQVTVPGIAQVYTVIDLDSAAVPADTAALRQYGTCKSHNAVRPITRVIRPRAANTIYRTGVTSAYALAPSRLWLDESNADVPHYGFKAACQLPVVPPVSNWLAWNIEATFYIACKNSR